MDFYIGQKLMKMVKSLVITFLWINNFFSSNIIAYEDYMVMCHLFFEKTNIFISL
jgi:hypothetical protein